MTNCASTGHLRFKPNKNTPYVRGVYAYRLNSPTRCLGDDVVHVYVNVAAPAVNAFILSVTIAIPIGG